MMDEAKAHAARDLLEEAMAAINSACILAGEVKGGGYAWSALCDAKRALAADHLCGDRTCAFWRPALEAGKVSHE